MSRQSALVLSGFVLGLVLVAALVSNSESRSDFLIRLEVGEIAVDGPELDPPVVDGPRIEGPQVDVPEVGGPSLDVLDVLVTIGLLLAAAAAVIAVVMVIRRFGPGGAATADGGRTTVLDTDEGRAGPFPNGEAGWAAFEQFLHVLLRDPDPARAIRIAMRYAESGFGRLDARQADETPLEWLSRVAVEHEDLEPTLNSLISAYSAVRFGGRSAAPAERDRAVASLRALARTASGPTPPDHPPASALAATS